MDMKCVFPNKNEDGCSVLSVSLQMPALVPRYEKLTKFPVSPPYCQECSLRSFCKRIHTLSKAYAVCAADNALVLELTCIMMICSVSVYEYFCICLSLCINKVEYFENPFERSRQLRIVRESNCKTVADCRNPVR